ncbi:unnamed protein product [Adineta steineri]|uniref:Uncharacterized protein n=1 Tax=Adineta steineri TaxID=433720 RepID=A0A816CDY9_9BILA|nr:unnamed protein product [Adineta steineri]CAF1424576.1 unnamed protein product [Adineta steineri]CAF1622044.1 unnamed protein product [Adineta steineri]CAF1622165.1 unnamed protein product [Adineta steineri]
MITTTTHLASRSFQSIMNEETLCDDVTTLNQNSSSSILYRKFNIHYISQEYIIRKESSSQMIKSQSFDPEVVISDNTKIQPDSPGSLNNLVNITPKNIAVIELITSEQRFVNDMKSILKTYITPMLENNILSSSHIDALFLNWPSLTRTHEKLAKTLITALKTDGEQISIGKILCQFIPELIAEYEVYFRFHPTAMKCFREQLHISPKFCAFMQKTKEHSYGIGTMGDANILTLPLQRIAKYPFMIYQILKNSSNDSDDFDQLHNSLKKADELRETINNAIDEEINRTKFEWLQKHVDCTKIYETIIFNSLTHFGDQRKLIHYNHIRLTKSTNNLFYAMLFNDFLLLTRTKRPLITKMFRIINHTMFHQCRQQNESFPKLSTRQSDIDWFDSPDANYLYLIVYKKPIMLHEIQNVRLLENDSTGFQFDYRGRQITLFANSINERFLWIKCINDAIHICSQRRLLTSMFRTPESNLNPVVCRPIGKVFIREINAMNLPITSMQKNGNNPYCIIEMNNSQRQTTPVHCDTSSLQWNISFQFFVCDINKDIIKCFIYNRSKYTTDRLLGSVDVPLTLLTERRIQQEDSSSTYSLATSNFSDMSSSNWKTRTLYLQHSSNNSQISIKYLVCFNE